MNNFNKMLSNNIIVVVILVICFLIVRSSISLFPVVIESNQTLQKQQKDLEAQITQAQAINSVIQDPVRRSEAARAQHFLSADGELIFVFPKVEDE